MTDNERKELYSARIVARGRDYFFDVKESRDGVKYLVISESKKEGGAYVHDRVMVFEDHLKEFLQGLNNALIHSGLQKKKRTFEEIREEYPRAYETWTSEENDLLKMKFDENCSFKELAVLFQRKPNAIRAHLIKLHLVSFKSNS